MDIADSYRYHLAIVPALVASNESEYANTSARIVTTPGWK